MKTNLRELLVKQYDPGLENNSKPVKRCPVCKEINLATTQWKAAEIDYCPKCGGMWLDHGEIETIIQHSTSELWELRIRRA